jgi:hypothetical protein
MRPTLPLAIGKITRLEVLHCRATHPRSFPLTPTRKTDDSADGATLENIAEVLAHSHNPDELHASVQLEAIAFAPTPQLYATLDFARKGLKPS